MATTLSEVAVAPEELLDAGWLLMVGAAVAVVETSPGPQALSNSSAVNVSNTDRKAWRKTSITRP